MEGQGNRTTTVHARLTGLRDEAFDLLDEVRHDEPARPQLLQELQTIANHLGEAERLSPRSAA